MKFYLYIFILTGLVFGANASEKHHVKTSKYAGQENQAIKSLSSADIQELRRGGGWGLAKAAELNGVPGPAHLLELKDQIPLSDEQIIEITQIYNAMNKAARMQGEFLIKLETDLEKHFKNRTINDQILRKQLRAIGEARTELRYIHLSTHLKTPSVLTEKQIAHYNKLRGYTNTDPCANVPEGHSAAMWRKHNACE